MGDPRIAVAEAAGVGIDGLDRPTEDHVALLPTAVILADGATALRDDERSGGWYAEHLCQALATDLTDDPRADLKTMLAKTITDLKREHLLTPGAAPSSTVAILRWTDDRVDALVLADSPIVAFTQQGAQVVADDRIATLAVPGGSYRQRLRAGGGYGPDHVAALRATGRTTGQRRNVPGGFWVAEADPAAATHARTASWPREDVTAALLASDGVSCGIDDYHLFDWPTVLKLATETGPSTVLTKVREAERTDPDGLRWPRPKRHDDQALVLVNF